MFISKGTLIDPTMTMRTQTRTTSSMVYPRRACPRLWQELTITSPFARPRADPCANGTPATPAKGQAAVPRHWAPGGGLRGSTEVSDCLPAWAGGVDVRLG